MQEKKHELLLLSLACVFCAAFFFYSMFDSPKYNSITATLKDTKHYTAASAAYSEQDTAPVPPTESSGKINLNTATAEQLETLEGIGKVKAAAIIEYRESNGRFRRVEELLSVDGITEKILVKNIDKLTV